MTVGTFFNCKECGRTVAYTPGEYFDWLSIGCGRSTKKCPAKQVMRADNRRDFNMLMLGKLLAACIILAIAFGGVYLAKWKTEYEQSQVVPRVGPILPYKPGIINSPRMAPITQQRITSCTFTPQGTVCR